MAATAPSFDRWAACEVTLQSMDFFMPPICASCGAPSEIRLNAVRRIAFGTILRSIPIPYCKVCASRVHSARQRRWALAGAAVVLGLASAGLGFLAPATSLAALCALSAAGAGALTFATRTVLEPRTPAPPAKASGEAVRLVAFRDYDSVLHCENAEWGAALARANGVAAAAKRRRRQLGLRSVVLALLVAPAAAVFVWMATHHTVFIDNAMEKPLAVWVDGTMMTIVTPRDRWKKPPAIHVPLGLHRFGYSKVGAARPEGQIDAQIGRDRVYLYNPGHTMCYRIGWAGSSHDDRPFDDEAPPLPQTDLYRFEAGTKLVFSPGASPVGGTAGPELAPASEREPPTSK